MLYVWWFLVLLETPSGLRPSAPATRNLLKQPQLLQNTPRVNAENPWVNAFPDPRRPRWPPRCLQDASKTPPRRPIWLPRRLEDVSKTAKMASREPKMAQDALRGPKDASKLSSWKARRGQNHRVSLVFDGFGIFILFGLPTDQDGPTGSQDRSKIAKEASKIAS